jgi:hypothetical protein
MFQKSQRKKKLRNRKNNLGVLKKIMFVICTSKMCRKMASLGKKTISKLEFFNYINLSSALLQLILEKMYPYST